MVRRGFTLIEMMVVVGIIVLLMAMLLPVGRMMLNRGAKDRTRALVIGIAAAIETYPRQHWSVSTEDPPGSGTLRQVTYPFLWDLNQEQPQGRPGDGLIDGDPATVADAEHDGPFWQPLIDSGYRGFTAMVKPDLRDSDAVNTIGQPVDAWGQPLRIAFDPNAHGARRYLVWSIGPNGVDEGGRGDDITSGDGP